VDFHGDYSLQDPTQITQTIYVRFEFPATDASYSDFAFQLLFAYLVDLIPLPIAFAISALVSLALVSGYLFAAVGRRFTSPQPAPE
jgi:hypothetical protein